ncbi:MAG: hypothetical protein QT05_C0049G0011 [archaeon GW2011_AR13]|nr:MAG: hypothetical protein QT05_C0049G0011 [archaeon GW2011_AR13]HIG94292.1 hypothetical protein [Nanoarchaeota archaeon]HIH63061.1 hypothetical protein [Nanoarchaeota archaeon]HIJ09512.1 hypothetical protein [Nanoarchaeota archaeon]
MTSIILFKTKNGERLFLAGDTQHAYDVSTYSKTKIFPLIAGKFLFAGSGSDLIINHVYNQSISCINLEDFKARIENAMSNENYAPSIETEQHIKYLNMGSGILVIDITNLTYKKFVNLKEQHNEEVNFAMIGSPNSEFIGQCQEKLFLVTDYEKEIFENFFECFDFLGKHDAMTGHPALFPVEIFCIEEGKIRKFKIKLKNRIYSDKFDIHKSDNYEVKKDD